MAAVRATVILEPPQIKYVTVSIVSPCICHGPSSERYGFSSRLVWLEELDHQESWALKIWCFWTVELKTGESPLDCKEIQPVHLKKISPEFPLEGLMLKLKLQYFGHLLLRITSLLFMSWHADSICCAMIKSASCVPGQISHFIDYFELSLLCSCTRNIPSWRS